MIDHHDRLIAKNDVAFLREIQRHDRNLLHVDIEPNVELRPIGNREHANAFPFVEAGVENIPQLGPLVFWVPLAQPIAE